MSMPQAAAMIGREAPSGTDVRRFWRMLAAPRMHHVLFVALTLISILPVFILASWVERSAVEKELASVEEKHLLIARNLNAALTRYANDAEAVFRLAAASGASGVQPPGLGDLLHTLRFRHVCVLDASGRVISAVAVPGIKPHLPEPDVRAALRDKA